VDKQEQEEMQKRQAESIAKKRAIAERNAVLWLLPQATNGDAFAQCDLGEHFLNGQGVETNRETAVYWLTQAAEKGNVEASNVLATLSH
jgi:TPR repeat protein